MQNDKSTCPSKVMEQRICGIESALQKNERVMLQLDTGLQHLATQIAQLSVIHKQLETAFFAHSTQFDAHEECQTPSEPVRRFLVYMKGDKPNFSGRANYQRDK